MLRVYGGNEELVKKVFNAAGKELDFAPEDVDAEVSFVTSEEIRELNKETRGMDKITDVLSFQLLEDVTLPLIKENYGAGDINEEDGSVMLGEILVCNEPPNTVIRKTGKRRFWCVTGFCICSVSITKTKKAKRK